MIICNYLFTKFINNKKHYTLNFYKRYSNTDTVEYNFLVITFDSHIKEFILMLKDLIPMHISSLQVNTDRVNAVK